MTGVTTLGQQTANSIRDHATDLFFQHGFEATTLRQIAASVGIKVGSLYNHINGKDELLLEIMGGTMDELMAMQEEAMAAHDDVIERIVALLQCHIRYHAQHAKVVFIGNSELRSLSPENRAAITQRRRDYRAIIENLIVEAGNAGRANVIDARFHAFSIVAMGTHVASWYRPAEGMPLDRIENIYSKIALRGLGVEMADEFVDKQIPITSK